MRKLADATSVPFADSAMDTAAAAPLPGLAVGNKPAPGQTGPRGMAPRTNYSRVNTGSPQPVDAGVTSQKGASPDSSNFLPPKIAGSEVHMSFSTHRSIQDMIKAAAEGTLEHAAVAVEAERQREAPGAKVASFALPTDVPSISTDYVLKLAGACEFMVGTWKEAAFALGTSQGAEQPKVLETTSSNNEFASGHQGQATPAHVVPKSPGTHKPSETPAGPSNALDDNESMKHKEQPVKLGGAVRPAPLVLTGTSKEAGARDAAITALGTAKGLGKDLVGKAKGLGGHVKGFAKEYPGAAAATAGSSGFLGGMGAEGALRKRESKKEASAVHPRLVDWYGKHMAKQAEDAINPAQISAGAAVPPETSAAGEAGGAPAGGQPQGPTSLVGSNEAAINYTKGTAKAPVKGQLASYLTEPALSSAHDSTLNQAFDHTGQAGVKISSVRSAAARAVLEKLSAEACSKEPKKKVSAGMSNFSAPQVTGAAAGPM
jgi:hypothetical protein